ncbi:hypothetical protein EJB05_08989, partial [Eragrostis curvula]
MLMGNITMAPELPIASTWMTSRCAPQATRGVLTFEITGYSLHKGLGVDRFIMSSVFEVGGYSWCIRYYPDGRHDSKGNAAVFLELLSKNAEVRALYDVRLLHRRRESLTSEPLFCAETPLFFSTMDVSQNMNTRGITSSKLLKRIEQLELEELEEESPYFYRDCLKIQCDITVIKEPWVFEVSATPKIKAEPYSTDLLRDLAALLKSEECADVTFVVQGQVFAAHTIILAMRSPVFKAMFYGSMREQGGHRRITIEDTKPAVFCALLHYIYTEDCTPCMSNLDKYDGKELTMHLLVAADQYHVQGLKSICEEVLSCHCIDVETVATMLALAGQHNCPMLKDKCSDFIARSKRLDDIIASDGFRDLRASCPAVLVDALVQAATSRRN